MTWEVKIRRADNGYIVEYPDELDDGTEVKIEEVFQFTKDEFDVMSFKTTNEEKIALGQVLFFVAEHFGELHDKYGEENLGIEFNKKGHKID